MKFTFTDKKVNIPNRVHTYAEKKIGKLDRYFQTEPETSIVCGRMPLTPTRRSPTSSLNRTKKRNPPISWSAPSGSSSAP